MKDPFRKPNPGMINYFIKSYKLLNDYTKGDMLMIGDASDSLPIRPVCN